MKTAQLRFIKVRLSAFFLCHDYRRKMAKNEAIPSKSRYDNMLCHAIGLQKPLLSNKVTLDDLEYIGSLRHVD